MGHRQDAGIWPPGKNHARLTGAIHLYTSKIRGIEWPLKKRYRDK